MKDNKSSKQGVSRARDDRARSWTFILYPPEVEPNTPTNWRDILDEQHIQWVESPIHDKDTNADGSYKKPHLHILLMFEGKKSFEQIKELTDLVNAPIPQKTASSRGLVRYMCHMDNPEKHQYNQSEIIGHGGADVSELLRPTSSTRYVLISEMMSYVKDNRVTEMSELLEYAMSERFEDWFPLLCDNSAYVMGQYLKSIRHGAERKMKEAKIDKSTGEIV